MIGIVDNRMNNARLFRNFPVFSEKKFRVQQTRINRINRAMNSLHVEQSHRSMLAQRASNVIIIVHEIDAQDIDHGIACRREQDERTLRDVASITSTMNCDAMLFRFKTPVF